MNKSRKLAAVLTAAGVLMSGSAVFADNTPESTYIPDYTITNSTAPVNEEQAPVFNGGTSTAPIAVKDGVRTVPLRQVMEALSFEVNWDDASQRILCLRGAVQIGLAIGEDGYTLAKTAPMPLGLAPYLYEGDTTYVPVALFTEIMGLREFSEDSDEFTALSEESLVTFKSLDSDDYGQIITVYDPARGEVVVRISDKTNITGIKLDELNDGDELNVYYDSAMTMSIPPQTTALAVEGKGQQEAEASDTAPFEGKIVEVNTEAEQIVIDENGTHRALTITDDTVISHGNDKRIYKFDDLAEGTTVKGIRHAAETRSIPPISVAISVEIQ